MPVQPASITKALSAMPSSAAGAAATEVVKPSPDRCGQITAAIPATKAAVPSAEGVDDNHSPSQHHTPARAESNRVVAVSTRTREESASPLELNATMTPVGAMEIETPQTAAATVMMGASTTSETKPSPSQVAAKAGDGAGPASPLQARCCLCGASQAHRDGLVDCPQYTGNELEARFGDLQRSVAVRPPPYVGTTCDRKATQGVEGGGDGAAVWAQATMADVRQWIFSAFLDSALPALAQRVAAGLAHPTIHAEAIKLFLGYADIRVLASAPASAAGLVPGCTVHALFTGSALRDVRAAFLVCGVEDPSSPSPFSLSPSGTTARKVVVAAGTAALDASATRIPLALLPPLAPVPTASAAGAGTGIATAAAKTTTPTTVVQSTASPAADGCNAEAAVSTLPTYAHAQPADGSHNTSTVVEFAPDDVGDATRPNGAALGTTSFAFNPSAKPFAPPPPPPPPLSLAPAAAMSSCLTTGGAGSSSASVLPSLRRAVQPLVPLTTITTTNNTATVTTTHTHTTMTAVLATSTSAAAAAAGATPPRGPNGGSSVAVTAATASGETTAAAAGVLAVHPQPSQLQQQHGWMTAMLPPLSSAEGNGVAAGKHVMSSVVMGGVASFLLGMGGGAAAAAASASFCATPSPVNVGRALNYSLSNGGTPTPTTTTTTATAQTSTTAALAAVISAASGCVVPSPSTTTNAAAAATASETSTAEVRPRPRPSVDAAALGAASIGAQSFAPLVITIGGTRIATPLPARFVPAPTTTATPQNAAATTPTTTATAAASSGGGSGAVVSASLAAASGGSAHDTSSGSADSRIYVPDASSIVLLTDDCPQRQQQEQEQHAGATEGSMVPPPAATSQPAPTASVPSASAEGAAAGDTTAAASAGPQSQNNNQPGWSFMVVGAMSYLERVGKTLGHMALLPHVTSVLVAATAGIAPLPSTQPLLSTTTRASGAGVGAHRCAGLSHADVTAAMQWLGPVVLDRLATVAAIDAASTCAYTCSPLHWAAVQRLVQLVSVDTLLRGTGRSAPQRTIRGLPAPATGSDGRSRVVGAGRDERSSNRHGDDTVANNASHRLDAAARATAVAHRVLLLSGTHRGTLHGPLADDRRACTVRLSHVPLSMPDLLVRLLAECFGVPLFMRTVAMGSNANNNNAGSPASAAIAALSYKLVFIEYTSPLEAQLCVQVLRHIAHHPPAFLKTLQPSTGRQTLVADLLEKTPIRGHHFGDAAVTFASVTEATGIPVDVDLSNGSGGERGGASIEAQWAAAAQRCAQHFALPSSSRRHRGAAVTETMVISRAERRGGAGGRLGTAAAGLSAAAASTAAAASPAKERRLGALVPCRYGMSLESVAEAVLLTGLSAALNTTSNTNTASTASSATDVSTSMKRMAEAILAHSPAAPRDITCVLEAATAHLTTLASSAPSTAATVPIAATASITAILDQAPFIRLAKQPTAACHTTSAGADDDEGPHESSPPTSRNGRSGGGHRGSGNGHAHGAPSLYDTYDEYRKCFPRVAREDPSVCVREVPYYVALLAAVGAHLHAATVRHCCRSTEDTHGPASGTAATATTIAPTVAPTTTSAAAAPVAPAAASFLSIVTRPHPTTAANSTATAATTASRRAADEVAAAIAAVVPATRVAGASKSTPIGIVPAAAVAAAAAPADRSGRRRNGRDGCDAAREGSANRTSSASTVTATSSGRGRQRRQQQPQQESEPLTATEDVEDARCSESEAPRRGGRRARGGGRGRKVPVDEEDACEVVQTTTTAAIAEPTAVASVAVAVNPVTTTPTVVRAFAPPPPPPGGPVLSWTPQPSPVPVVRHTPVLVHDMSAEEAAGAEGHAPGKAQPHRRQRSDACGATAPRPLRGIANRNADTSDDTTTTTAVMVPAAASTETIPPPRRSSTATTTTTTTNATNANTNAVATTAVMRSPVVLRSPAVASAGHGPCPQALSAAAARARATGSVFLTEHELFASAALFFNDLFDTAAGEVRPPTIAACRGAPARLEALQAHVTAAFEAARDAVEHALTLKDLPSRLEAMAAAAEELQTLMDVCDPRVPTTLSSNNSASSEAAGSGAASAMLVAARRRSPPPRVPDQMVVAREKPLSLYLQATAFQLVWIMEVLALEAVVSTPLHSHSQSQSHAAAQQALRRLCPHGARAALYTLLDALEGPVQQLQQYFGTALSLLAAGDATSSRVRVAAIPDALAPSTSPMTHAAFVAHAYVYAVAEAREVVARLLVLGTMLEGSGTRVGEVLQTTAWELSDALRLPAGIRPPGHHAGPPQGLHDVSWFGDSPNMSTLSAGATPLSLPPRAPAAASAAISGALSTSLLGGASDAPLTQRFPALVSRTSPQPATAPHHAAPATSHNNSSQLDGAAHNHSNNNSSASSASGALYVIAVRGALEAARRATTRHRLLEVLFPDVAAAIAHAAMTQQGPHKAVGEVPHQGEEAPAAMAVLPPALAAPLLGNSDPVSGRDGTASTSASRGGAPAVVLHRYFMGGSMDLPAAEGLFEPSTARIEQLRTAARRVLRAGAEPPAHFLRSQ